MKLEFRNEEEFKEFIYEFVLDMLEYIGKDEEKFKNFCTAFFSVIYCEDKNEEFEKWNNMIKEAMQKPFGKILLKAVQENIKELRKSKKELEEIQKRFAKDEQEGDLNERFKDNT